MQDAKNFVLALSPCARESKASMQANHFSPVRLRKSNGKHSNLNKTVQADSAKFKKARYVTL